MSDLINEIKKVENAKILNPKNLVSSPSKIILSTDVDYEKQLYDAKKENININAFNDISYLLKDILSGDTKQLENPLIAGLNFNKIKIALNWLLSLDNDNELKKLLSTNAWILNYRAKPPTPEEFIDKKFIGEMNLHWWLRDYFLDFFDPLKPLRSAVLYSCIGAGKSTLTTLIFLYVSVLFAYMRCPYKYFGRASSTQFTMVFAGWSQKKASEILLEPLFNMMRESEFFVQCRTAEDMIKKNKEFDNAETIDCIYWTKASPTSVMAMSNGLNYKIASSNSDIIGQNMVCGAMTELAFFHEDYGWSYDKIMRFFTKMRDRIDNRMRGDYMGRFILDSSPCDLESPVDQWINFDAPKDRSIKIFSGANWDFFKDRYDENCFDKHGKVRHDWRYNFPIHKGGNGIEPHVIDSESELSNTDNNDVVWVPRFSDTISLYDKARMDCVTFLKDQAGIPAGAADRIFYNNQIIEDIFDNQLVNVYNSITAPAMEEPEHLIWNQIRDKFFIKNLSNWTYYYKPDLPRAISIDQSETGDATCIAMSHVEKDCSRRDDFGDPVKVYVTDFTIVIIPKGGIINLDAIKWFIMDLRDLGNLNIQAVSYDRFQSDPQRQFLQRHNIKVDYLSVDKTNEHYLNYIDYAFHRRVFCGRNIHYKNNLKSIKMTKRKSGTTKIDHIIAENIHEGDAAWETSQIGMNAKDALDAVVGSIALLNKYDTIFIPYSEWIKDKAKMKTNEEKYDEMKDKLSKLNLYF